MSIPIKIISSNLGSIFRAQAIDDFQQHGNCKKTFLKTARLLLITALPPFLIILLAGHSIFNIYLGNKWHGVGIYAQIFSFRFLFAFIVSPLTYIVYVKEKQHIDLVWQTVLFIGLTAITIVAGVLNNYMLFFIGNISYYSVMYMCYLPVLFKLSCG